MPSVSSKGQVTIPRRVRESLNIKTGDSVVFEVSKKKSRAILRKVSKPSLLDFAGKVERPTGVSVSRLRKAVKDAVAKRVARTGVKR